MTTLAGLATDTQAEVHGRWTSIPGAGEIRMRLGRMFNSEYDAFFTAERVRLQEEHGANPVPEKEIETLQLRAVSRFVVRDWAFVDGVLDKDGMPSFDAGGVHVREVFIAEQWYRVVGESEDEIACLPIIRYTPALGVRLFGDPRFRDLYAQVQTLAFKASRYREQAVQASAGN